MNNEFEKYWMAHRKQLLSANDEYRRVEDSYKIKSGADLLLFGIPAVVGITFLSVCPMASELLKWLLSAVVTVVCFVVCVWVKSVLSGERSLEEIEREIKDEELKKWNSRQ